MLSLIQDTLGDFNPAVRVTEHYVDVEHGIEYLSLRISIPRPNTSITIREYKTKGHQ